MKKIIFILISILTFSCNKDETIYPTGKTALNLVTGINCRETENPDEIALKLGNPNVLVSNKFFVYPNPAKKFVYISAQENITNIWIVPAKPEKIYQDENFISILNTNLYSEQAIISDSNFSLNGQSSKNYSINTEAFAKGYYKVFVKIGGIIYWDNLYKYENQGDNEEQFTAISDFWK